MTDAELLRSVQAGDLSAWEQLYHRYLPTIWRYVYLQVSGDKYLAEDVVSETVLALVRQISSLTPGNGNISGWLLAVARNKIGDHRRNMARGALAARMGNMGHVLAAAATTPHTSLEAAETRKHVIAIMEQLPDEERLVLEWKYLEDLSVGEIASRFGRTEKAVESVLYRARRSFRLLFRSVFGTNL